MIQDYGAARENKLENQVRTNDVTDLSIQDAKRALPRERFSAPGRTFLAYAESTVEYAPGWSLMAPRDVAKLLHAIRPRPGERALAICAPYAAAVLARMGVATTLRLPAGDCVKAAEAGLSGEAVTIVAGDPATPGDGGPYDVIVCEGAVERTPAAWLAALAVGGRLGVVERRGPVGKARIYLRGEDGLVAEREVFDATPPVMPGFEAVGGFAF